ncbi:uncharacterized protein LOC118756334 [Rhagoletis pomonella]|uniref:uncharacterized protein LOC118756334 n=1 Tax=Rhagoletis pomonella TaxID=28610 RepID=UPI0017819E54|nr:uncharacterized protein LOC118756334 [Rhagoletis pomonella]
MNLNNSELFSLNILRAVEADDMDNPDPEDTEFCKLILEWGFSHKIAEFKAQAITLKNLQYLTESDLADLFKNDTIGARAEFRHQLITWRKTNGYGSVSTCDTASANSGFVDFVQQWRQRINNGIESPSCSQTSSSSSHDFDLKQVLSAHPTGEYVLRLDKLDDAGRKILIDATVSWFIKRKIKICRNIFQSIAQDIANRFKDDKSIYYHKDPITLRPAGRLYDKYYNTLKRLRKSGELVDPESSTPEASPTEEYTFTFEDEKSAYDWLKLFDSPWSTVEANWKKTFKIRRQEILNSSGSTSAKTLRAWKLFSHSCGYNLIDIDFNALHQNCSQLTEKWQGFRTKIIPILNKRVKDIQNLQHLKKVNEIDKGSDQLIALLLHVVLRPNIKRKAGDKTIFRSTIKDSQLSFLLQVSTVNDVENKLDNLKKSLYARGETLQPLIIAIGSDLSNCKFYVYYDDIKYELPSFLSALDICFKTFHVLHLKYPQDSIEFWTFVQRYFYSIELTEDKTSQNVLCLLRDLI